MNRPRRLLRHGFSAALGGAAAIVILPDVLGLDRRLPMIATVAWRPHAAVAAASGAALLGLWRPARPAAAALATAAAAGLVAVGARTTRPSSATGSGGAELTILCVNVLNGRADAGAVAALVEREEPDFVVLPEAGCDFRDKLAPLVDALGYRGWASTPPGVRDINGVALFAGRRAGALRVQITSGLRLPSLQASGGILGRRELHAVHTTAPRFPQLVARWRCDLEQLGRWTRAEPAPLVVGDLNATLDNAPLRRALGGCTSAAPRLGGLVGTFPASFPRWFGIQIDHVLVPTGTTTTRFAVCDVAGTDHRGVLARVRLPI